MDIEYNTVFSSLVLGIVSLILLYWYSTRNHGYWKSKGVKCMKPSPFVGNMGDFFRKYIHEVDVERYKKYGKVYGYYEGNNPILCVSKPELLRSIFVKDFFSFTNRRMFPNNVKMANLMLTNLEGEDWRRVRSVISPTFSTGKLKRILGIFKDCTNTLLQNFRTAASKGESAEVKTLFQAFTMDVIASSSFSVKIDSHNDPENDFVKNARAVFGQSGVSWKLFIALFAPRLGRLIGIKIFDPEPFEFFKNTTLQVIQERKRTRKAGNDFLQLLMDATQEFSDIAENETEDIASNYAQDSSFHPVFSGIKNKHMSTDELIAQCVLFFISGFESTAATLSFAAYSLALHPKVQDKARQEVDKVLEENEGQLTYECLHAMKYIDNIISETLRIHPVAIRIERVADADYELGHTGITVPRGMIVSVPVYAMHVDPKYFPDPQNFNPDRFSPEEVAKRSPYTYIPFGTGPRNCVGMRFALMQAKICLALVLSNFIIKKSPKTKVPLELIKGQGFFQAKEIFLDFEVRDRSETQ